MYFYGQECYMSPKIEVNFYHWENGFDGISSSTRWAYAVALTKFKVSTKLTQLNSQTKAICHSLLFLSTGRFQFLLPLRSFTTLQAPNDLSCLGYKENSISRFSQKEKYLPNSSVILVNLCNEVHRPYECSRFTEVCLISPLLIELRNHLLHCSPTKLHQ